MTWRNDIRSDRKKSLCWDVADPGNKAAVTLFSCHGQGGNQLWKFNKVSIYSEVKKHHVSSLLKALEKCFNILSILQDKQWLMHGGNPRCLDCDPSTRQLYVAECDPDSETQRWIFE